MQNRTLSDSDPLAGFNLKCKKSVPLQFSKTSLFFHISFVAHVCTLVLEWPSGQLESGLYF